MSHQDKKKETYPKWHGLAQPLVDAVNAVVTEEDREISIERVKTDGKTVLVISISDAKNKNTA